MPVYRFPEHPPRKQAQRGFVCLNVECFCLFQRRAERAGAGERLWNAFQNGITSSIAPHRTAYIF